MRIRFNWREWWQAEGFGVIYATVLCFVMAVVGLAAEDRGLAVLSGVLWLLCFVYCAGWQLLCFAVAKLRAHMGWLTYEPARGDQSERSDQ